MKDSIGGGNEVAGIENDYYQTAVRVAGALTSEGKLLIIISLRRSRRSEHYNKSCSLR
jgi:hypothetical protein